MADSLSMGSRIDFLQMVYREEEIILVENILIWFDDRICYFSDNCCLSDFSEKQFITADYFMVDQLWYSDCSGNLDVDCAKKYICGKGEKT